nr:Na(+)/H(+) antiporter subunit C [Bogoriella caseilytica]
MIEVTPSLALLLAAGVLCGTGVYLLLERSLTRIVIGMALLGNGVNLLLLVAGGRAGGPPVLGQTEPEDMSDPLPQAMVLTSIVITLGVTAFLLAMAYRSWQLNGHDEVQDDLEDRRVAERAARDEVSERATDDPGEYLAEPNDVVVEAEARDETRPELRRGGRKKGAEPNDVVVEAEARDETRPELRRGGRKKGSEPNSANESDSGEGGSR